MKNQLIMPPSKRDEEEVIKGDGLKTLTSNNYEPGFQYHWLK